MILQISEIPQTNTSDSSPFPDKMIIWSNFPMLDPEPSPNLLRYLFIRGQRWTVPPLKRLFRDMRCEVWCWTVDAFLLHDRSRETIFQNADASGRINRGVSDLAESTLLLTSVRQCSDMRSAPSAAHLCYNKQEMRTDISSPTVMGSQTLFMHRKQLY